MRCFYNTHMSSSKVEEAEKILEVFKLSFDYLNKVANTFANEINYGLSGDENIRRRTVLPMVKTFITNAPEQESKLCLESGRFLGIDLGGTNFRIVMVELGAGEPKFETETEPLPKDLLSLPCVNLYNYMASKLFNFLKLRQLNEEHLKLGYVFSYPSTQESVKCAKLITWTQTFHCPDGVGEDAGKLLQDAINRRNDCNVEVACVLNDTTATLLAGSFNDSQAAVGVIIGTGANAAYFETMDRLQWFSDKHFPNNQPKQMIIDIEWGCFGDDGSIKEIKTKYDAEVDQNSNHVGSYTFEKMFSGHYFGEMCRAVLADLSNQGFFLKPNYKPEAIFKAWKLDTVLISPIAGDLEQNNFPTTRAVLEKLGVSSIADDDDVKIMHMVCKALTQRAGEIVAAALATIVRHLSRSELTISFDGSFYRCQPGLADQIGKTLSVLCPETKVKLSLVTDGSGRGGALAAAAVSSV